MWESQTESRYVLYFPIPKLHCCHFSHLLQMPLILSTASVRETNFMSRLKSFLSNKGSSDHPSWNGHLSFMNTHCNYCYATCFILPENSKRTCHCCNLTAMSESCPIRVQRHSVTTEQVPRLHCFPFTPLLSLIFA